MPKIFLIFCLLFFQITQAQQFLQPSKPANRWVDSVFNELTQEQKIAQLMIIRAHSNLGNEHVNRVTELIKKYNVGGLCFFQGGPVRQAKLTNYYQQLAITPMLICIDAEWGLGMRLDSVIAFPKNFALGAVQNAATIYKVGNAIGNQCKRLGIHVNFAPVIDVNNNPNNPVINDRSFGENPEHVSTHATQFMKGLQDAGVMACAKHFPGHGDVAVDSHLDLPIINKTVSQLDSVELYPFKQLIKENVSSVMMAHLYVPSIDSTKNLATSLSKKAVNDLLKKDLKFKGLSFTDGLEMKGVTKYFPNAEISVQSLIAGNDVLLLPEDIELSIKKIDSAIADGRICKKDFEKSVKKVLLAKYNLGLNTTKTIDTLNIVSELNATTNSLIKEIAENGITALNSNLSNLAVNDNVRKIIHISLGNGFENYFSNILQKEFNATTFYFAINQPVNPKIVDSIEPKPGVYIKDEVSKYGYAKSILDSISKRDDYDAIIVSIQSYNRRPANNFGLGEADIFLLQNLMKNPKANAFFFGNPYAIKNVCGYKNIVACYDENEATQQLSVDIILNKFKPKGKLPVTVCD
ncbi:MAG: hypothetical protein KGZ59_03185 [Chitinophagaceae bacterium]|nr:hypothetical protein [Chitinophagaceae bacterium]